jgi:manganese/zinc/iron transport system permease protein
MSPLITVLIGTSLLGCVAGVVGSFAVLRRRALVGDLIAHAALPGICLAFVLAGERQFAVLLLGALVSGVLGVSLVTFIGRWTRTKEDAAIGIVLSTFFGAGIAMIPIILRRASGNKAGLETYLYGQAASMVRQDLVLIAIIAMIALALVVLFYKEFKLLSFDIGFARAQGWPTLMLDLAMMGLVALVTVVGLPAVGVVLMAAMLITPAATARLWTNRLSWMLLIAGILGAATGAMGTILSDDRWRAALPFDPLRFGTNNKGLPTGPLIVLSGTALFLFSLAFAPRRGLVARAVGRLQLRNRIAREHLLRTLYEFSELSLPKPPHVAFNNLIGAHTWSSAESYLLLRWGVRKGFIDRSGSDVRLTTLGIQEAAELTRRHRLWELFLIHGVNIAPDHVDRDADDIEHLLPPDVIERLEAEWLRLHPTKPGVIVPDSPHHIATPVAASTVEAIHE